MGIQKDKNEVVALSARALNWMEPSYRGGLRFDALCGYQTGF